MNNYDNNGWNTNKNYNNTGHYENNQDNDEVVSVGGWIGILILTAIPIINIIALFIMAFSHGNRNIKNYAKASLIIVAIPLTLLILIKACA